MDWRLEPFDDAAAAASTTENMSVGVVESRKRKKRAGKSDPDYRDRIKEVQKWKKVQKKRNFILFPNSSKNEKQKSQRWCRNEAITERKNHIWSHDNTDFIN